MCPNTSVMALASCHTRVPGHDLNKSSFFTMASSSFGRHQQSQTHPTTTPRLNPPAHEISQDRSIRSRPQPEVPQRRHHLSGICHRVSRGHLGVSRGYTVSTACDSKQTTTKPSDTGPIWVGLPDLETYKFLEDTSPTHLEGIRGKNSDPQIFCFSPTRTHDPGISHPRVPSRSPRSIPGYLGGTGGSRGTLGYPRV
jgi:hypothetical protein